MIKISKEEQEANDKISMYWTAHDLCKELEKNLIRAKRLTNKLFKIAKKASKKIGDKSC